MTLGNAAAAHVRLIVWCKACGHQVEPDAAEMAERYGAGTSVPEWRERLVCSQCGSRNVNMVVTGPERVLLEQGTDPRGRARLLRDMEKAKGGNPNLSQITTSSPRTLTDLGISRDQSSRWQKLAAVPQDE
jgi:hypothetical protein